jgi:hypothetical protein
MSAKPRIPFHFQAQAHAFSGTFQRPLVYPIEAQAATSLPTIGGHTSSRVENFCADHLVRFAAAHCYVSGGWQDDEIATTQSTAAIEGLNILDFVTADRIVAHLTSELHRGDVEGHIVALGSTFDGLKIGGHDVKVTLRHDLLLECKDFDSLRKRVAKDKKPDKISATTDGVALCSLVEEIKTDLPGLEKSGHILRIPHFGEIAVAEVFAAFGTRTLTMLRLKLGSPTSGTATVTECLINGLPSPPIGG